LRGDFFSKKSPLKLPQKNSNFGDDLLVIEMILSPTTKSFIRLFLLTTTLHKNGTFFRKSPPSSSPKKLKLWGNDLIVSKLLHHQEIKSFDRTFSKVRGWRAEPPRSDSLDAPRLCNHIQPRRRLMATIFHEFEKDGIAVFLFIGF